MSHETAGPSGPTAKFPLGDIVATSGVRDSVPPEEIQSALSRHVRGEWGDLDFHDLVVNETALAKGGRLFSEHRSALNVTFYIITECDRSRTTVLLPEEY